MRAYIIKILLLFILSTINIAQVVEPKITLDRKKLVILTSKDGNNEITDKIYQIASSAATQLKRYYVIDRSQIERILKEQKLQHSGVVDQIQAVEIGKVAAADEALFISITNFGQKGVPTEIQEEKDEEEEPNTGLFGWIIKEIVKAEIDKDMEDVERFPNNINTVIDGEVQLINVETSQTNASFSIHADHTGGVKAKSLSYALKQIRSEIYTNLKNIFQLSSEVLDIQGNDVTLLLGKNMGVNSGTLFEIVSRAEKMTVRDQKITIPGESIGFVEIKTVSIDACEGRVLRKWGEIEPGFQAHEITDGIFTGGISGIFGNNPENMRLHLFGNIKPFNQLGGEVYGDIGVVKDSRDDSDFQIGLGFSLHYRLMKTSSFTLGPIINIPFDFHMRTDDNNENGESHTVYLPITSPRLGLQSEIMLSPKIDLVIRGEYVLTSANMGDWRYTEKQEDNEDETEVWNAHWEADEGPAPEIEYHGWIITLGIRSTFFSSFTFN